MVSQSPDYCSYTEPRVKYEVCRRSCGTCSGTAGHVLNMRCAAGPACGTCAGKLITCKI